MIDTIMTPRLTNKNLRNIDWGFVGSTKYFWEKICRPSKIKKVSVYCPKIEPIKISTRMPIRKILLILTSIKFDEIVSTNKAIKYSG